MDSSTSNDEDTVTNQELYLVYAKLWASLNDCVDDEYKLIPANGIKPTYREAKNFWKAMKNPRRRKLLWIATGFVHEEFPDDEEQFRKEEAAGLINDTNVTTGADDEDESSDSDDDISDLDDENIPSVVNYVPVTPQNAVDNGRPAQVEDISSNENVPPASVTASSIPSKIGPIQTQMGSLNVTTSDSPAMIPAPPSVTSASSVVTSTSSSVPSAVVAFSAPQAEDEIMLDAIVETVFDDDDMSASSRVPLRSVGKESPVSDSSDSPVPVSSQTFSQRPKKNTPKRKRVIISDDSEEEEAKLKDEAEATSYFDEQISSPKTQPKNTERKKKPITPKPSSSKSRIQTRSALKEQTARKTVTKRGNTKDSDESSTSDDGNSNYVKKGFRRDYSTLNDDESDVTSSASEKTSSMNEFVVSDDHIEYESSSGSSTEKTSESSKTPESIDEEVFTRDDSVERDLPASPPRAITKNKIATPKSAPLLAHVGKSRYSSDTSRTPRQTPSSKSSFVASPRQTEPVLKRLQSAAAEIKRRSSNSNKSVPQHSVPSPDDPKPGPSTQRKSRESRDSTNDSRRSTSSVRFGSATRNIEDNSSHSSTTTKLKPTIPGGYELIQRENKRSFDEPQGPVLLIIYVKNGEKYYRRYRPQGNGYYNQTIPCNDYHCIRCKKNGKQTLLKVVIRTNNTYAEIKHHPNCEMVRYTMEDEDD